MADVRRPEQVAGTYPYNLQTTAVAVTRIIFTDLARTIVAAGGAEAACTGAGAAWTGTIPAGLAAGTYYLRHRRQFVTGGPIDNDDDDTLTLFVPGGSVADVLPTWAPSPAQVAALIPQRALTTNGDVVAAGFTSSTIPTDTQVNALTAQVAAEVQAMTGSLPAALQATATGVVALGTAALVELGYFPDDPDRSAYGTLRARYNEALERLTRAVADYSSDGTVDAAGVMPLPLYSYPTAATSDPTTWVTRF